MDNEYIDRAILNNRVRGLEHEIDAIFESHTLSPGSRSHIAALRVKHQELRAKLLGFDNLSVGGAEATRYGAS